MIDWAIFRQISFGSDIILSCDCGCWVVFVELECARATRDRLTISDKSSVKHIYADVAMLILDNNVETGGVGEA